MASGAETLLDPYGCAHGDPVGDFLMRAHPALAAASASGRMSRRGSATGASGLSRDLKTVTHDPTELSLLGWRSLCPRQWGRCSLVPSDVWLVARRSVRRSPARA